MSRKKNRVPKSGPVWHRTAEQATLDRMPKYNSHCCKTGAHGDAKYNRAKQKQAWQRAMNAEGARNRGLLPFSMMALPGLPLVHLILCFTIVVQLRGGRERSMRFDSWMP